MIPTIHLHPHREAVRIRVWTDADGLVMASLGQGLGEVTLRLRQDDAATLALALARALRVPTDKGQGGPGTGGPPTSRQLECPPARRQGNGKEVLR